MPNPIIDGIAHVAYTVKDMKKSLYFYTKVLGFKHAFTLPAQGEPRIEYLKICQDQFIELFYDRSDKEPVPPKSTNNHICLSVEDIHEVQRVLEAENIELVIPIRGREGGNWQCWCRDPDGNYIEFMYIHPDSQQARA